MRGAPSGFMTHRDQPIAEALAPSSAALKSTTSGSFAEVHEHRKGDADVQRAQTP